MNGVGKEEVKVKVQVDTSDFQAFFNFTSKQNKFKRQDILFGMPHNDLGTFQKAGLLAEVPWGASLEQV